MSRCISPTIKMGRILSSFRHAKLILEKVQLLSAESMPLEVGINDGKGGTGFFPFQKSSGCLGWKLKGTTICGPWKPGWMLEFRVWCCRVWGYWFISPFLGSPFDPSPFEHWTLNIIQETSFLGKIIGRDIWFHLITRRLLSPFCKTMSATTRGGAEFFFRVNDDRAGSFVGEKKW